MSDLDIKVKPAPERGTGWYDVYVDGEVAAQISKKIEHYNLARPITTTSWFVWIEHKKMDGYPYRTRRAAVAALRDRLDKEHSNAQ